MIAAHYAAWRDSTTAANNPFIADDEADSHVDESHAAGLRMANAPAQGIADVMAKLQVWQYEVSRPLGELPDALMAAVMRDLEHLDQVLTMARS